MVFRVETAILWLVAVGVFGPSSIAGQGLDVSDPMQSYLRTSQLSVTDVSASMMILPLRSFESSSQDGRKEGPWVDVPAVKMFHIGNEDGLVWDFDVRSFYNSSYPTRNNDGSVWQGRGLTAVVDGGGIVRWKSLRVSFRPSIRWNANGHFSLAPHDFSGQPEGAYPWRWIDLPQRFGPNPFWKVDLGQSEVGVDFGRFEAGLTTRDAWWGPGRRNAIVLSNAAGGMPRAFLGSSKPMVLGSTRIEWRWVFGRLARSDWFLPQDQDRGRYLTGWILAISPEQVPGLHIGGAFMSYGRLSSEGASTADYTANFIPGDTTRADQLGSVFLRWVLPESGFEVYGEWARNDRSMDIEDFLLEPEHSQGYTLGFEKLLDWGPKGGVSLMAELTHLQAEGTSRLRDNPTFYAHSVALEGYTHRGQLLGAVVGPGGVQQHLSARIFSPKGSTRFWIQRTVKDNDAFYEWADNTDFGGCLFCQHDVTFTAGTEVVVFTDSFVTGWSGSISRQRNRWFEGPDVWNLNLGARMRISGLLNRKNR